MTDTTDIALGRASRRLRLDTLIRLRWLAVAGQTAAVVGVHYGLGFSMPLPGCLLLIVLSAWLNIALRFAYPVNHRLRSGAASALLAFDVLQLGALLYLTGGLENPFSVLFLAPVLISATALSPGRTLALGLLVIITATVLAFHHLPLPWHEDDPLDLPTLYVVGVWASILLGVTFTAVYAWRVSAEANDLADALAAAELVMAREQHFSQLDGLAAAAAHELGTPLATITLVAKEIANSAPKGTPLADDIALLRQEAERCRAILAKLATLNEDGSPLEQLSLNGLLEEIAGPQRPFGVAIAVAADGVGPEPVTRRNPAIIYGIGNLVDNAVDFAASAVTLTGAWSAETVTVEVGDDGSGFPPDVLVRAGDPYIRSRSRARPKVKGEAREGLGLGLFIAKTLLERHGAQLTFANRFGGGAMIRIVWPRAVFDAPRQPEAPLRTSQPLEQPI
jgi:two-component system, sensor histidine kinase RegB